MSDITKHKWSDVYTKVKIEDDNIVLYGCLGDVQAIFLNKDDSTVIAKHFYDLMTDKEKIDFFHVMNKKQRDSHPLGGSGIGGIAQPETTIKHHLGAIGDMKRND